MARIEAWHFLWTHFDLANEENKEVTVKMDALEPGYLCQCESSVSLLFHGEWWMVYDQ